MAFTCPRCGATSQDPNDEREGYCGRCHDWTAALPVRPRFGRLRRADGSVVPLVFHPVPRVEGTFVGLRADDEGTVVLWPGDQAEVDVLAPGQTVVFDVEESNP